jgi:hypothetical protein
LSLDILQFCIFYASSSSLGQSWALCSQHLDGVEWLAISDRNRFHDFISRFECIFLGSRFQEWPYLMVSDASHNSWEYVIQEDFHLEEMILPFQQPYHANIQSLYVQMFILGLLLSVDGEIYTLYPCKNSLQIKSTFFRGWIL